ncbi:MULTISPECIES: amino acid permease [unclassified Pseudoxanthomonas]|uniref:APC family permease n=1 Tax=unclassified Pseudoxanthomonas TaxID=2645906 RepID=UPI0008ED061D|nr:MULTISPECIES: amino acid permease [unclassified Pseudoxanthomonas]PPJ43026.1 amino acid permease [Pseudoxanthomonas sp. KAs_5_3]SFV33961.1 amino acid/polyamine/organocation transporter, APC superfamily [Pseudoxanthomonas sp. YR558]
MQPHDRRKIGFWTCTALVVGNTIGMGIFVLPASLAPFGYNALLGWGITVLGCLALARVFARLARLLPDADGPYGYVRHTLGDLPAYAVLWSYWVSNWITLAALATGVAGYAAAIFPPLARVQPAVVCLGVLWLFVGINLLGVRSGGRVQVVTTVMKLMPMLAVAALGAWTLIESPASFGAHPPAKPISLGDAMAASTLALFAMLGIESATIPAAKVEDPGRTIPRATMTGTGITAAIYLVVSAVPLLLLPHAELAQSSAPFALVMERFAGEGTGRWIALFVVVSGLGALNGWTLLSGEMMRTMADNGTMPKVFARTNRFGAPIGALVLTALLASAMVLMNYSESAVAGFTFLSTVVTAANLPLYLGCSLALGVLWWRGQRDAGRDLLVAAVIGTAYTVFAFIGMGAQPFWLALALMVAGLPLYFFLRRRPGNAVPHA